MSIVSYETYELPQMIAFMYTKTCFYFPITSIRYSSYKNWRLSTIGSCLKVSTSSELSHKIIRHLIFAKWTIYWKKWRVELKLYSVDVMASPVRVFVPMTFNFIFDAKHKSHLLSFKAQNMEKHGNYNLTSFQSVPELEDVFQSMNLNHPKLIMKSYLGLTVKCCERFWTFWGSTRNCTLSGTIIREAYLSFGLEINKVWAMFTCTYVSNIKQLWTNFAVLTCTARISAGRRAVGDVYPLFRWNCCLAYLYHLLTYILGQVSSCPLQGPQLYAKHRQRKLTSSYNLGSHLLSMPAWSIHLGPPESAGTPASP